MPCALALLIATAALIRSSLSARLGLRYGAALGLCVWLVPFGLSFALVGT